MAYTFEMHERKLVGLFGIASVFLSLLIAMIPPPPALGAAAGTVVAYYKANQMQVLVLNYMGLVGLLPSFVLMAYTAATVKKAEADGGWLWILVLMTGLFCNAGGFGLLVMIQGTAYFASHAAPEIVSVVADLGQLWFGLFFVAAAGYLLAFTWAVLKTRVWPSWIAYLALLSGVVVLVASLGAVATSSVLVADGIATLIAFGSFLIWLLAFSILILVKSPAQLQA